MNISVGADLEDDGVFVAVGSVDGDPGAVAQGLLKVHHIQPLIIPLLDRFENLTVVTNSPQASIALAEMKIRNHCTGGRMLNNSCAYVGAATVRFLEDLQADVLFFSCRGLSEAGVLSDSQEEEVQVRRAMLAHADRKIFLCDSSKQGSSYPYRLCRLEDVDEMITEK